VILASELESSDAEFIVTARGLLPQLVEEIRRRRRSTAE
jgi:hypothetical protein